MIKALVVLVLTISLLSSCTSVTVNVPPGTSTGTYTITVYANKQIPFSGAISPAGNTVPIGAVP